MKNLDPLIRREYKRLGMNIVPDDALADLIFAKVQYARLRMIAIVAVVISAVIVGAFFGWRATDSSAPVNATNSSNSLSFTQESTGGDVLPLPQAGYRTVDASDPKSAKLEYTFALEAGWIIQEITDNPDPIMGPAGTVDVFEITQGEERLVQQYQMSSRTQINEFGVPRSGIFKFVLTFTNPTFKGQVRVAFVRSL